MNPFFTTTIWNQVFLYLLFIFSTFSIAGIEASITILYLISLIRLIRNRRIPKFNNPLLWAIIFFMTVSVISGLLNEYETNNFLALRTNWRLILPILLGLILSEVNEDRLLFVFFGCVMLIAIYGIIQFFTGVDWLRPDTQNFSTPYTLGIGGQSSVFHGKGNFSHHLTYGGFLLITYSLLFSLVFCKEWSLFNRVILAVITILTLIAIGSSLGRSIWLGTIVTTTVLLFRISPKLMIALSICLISIGSYLFIEFGETSLKTSPTNSRIELVKKRIISGFKIKSNQDRILMWESGIAAIKDHFWLGIGYDNDDKVIPFYRKGIIERTGHRFWTNASTGVHNIYLQTWINYGIFGFLGYLSIFVIFLSQCLVSISITKKFDYENSILWAGFSGVLGFMVAGFFENNFRDGEVQVILLILLGLCLRQIQKLKRRIF